MDKVTKMYADAMESQSACNASGLINSLAQNLDMIWDEVRSGKYPTFHEHPVVVLFATQIHNLCGSPELHFTKWTKAYKVCEEEANKRPLHQPAPPQWAGVKVPEVKDGKVISH